MPTLSLEKFNVRALIGCFAAGLAIFCGPPLAHADGTEPPQPTQAQLAEIRQRDGAYWAEHNPRGGSGYYPYNWNFFDKYRTDAHYCSQLVWAAWKSQHVDLDRAPDQGTWLAGLVTPAELANLKVSVKLR